MKLHINSVSPAHQLFIHFTGTIIKLVKGFWTSDGLTALINGWELYNLNKVNMSNNNVKSQNALDLIVTAEFKDWWV